jgi:hypothetical protein
MFGFMIIRLLIDNQTIQSNSVNFINESVKNLQKIAYPNDSLEYNEKAVN